MKPLQACLCLCLAGVLGLGGCGPRLSVDELGTVVDRMPLIPGTERPYEMPQLGPENPPAEPTQ
jgi:hypothetical protein